MINYCPHCNRYYLDDELDVIHTSYESYYGVGSSFDSTTSMNLPVCPICKCEVEELEDEEEICDELNRLARQNDKAWICCL